MVKDRAMVYLNGTMEKFFKEDGRMEWKTGLEFGDLQKGTIIKEIGLTIDNMAKAYLGIV